MLLKECASRSGIQSNLLCCATGKSPIGRKVDKHRDALVTELIEICRLGIQRPLAGVLGVVGKNGLFVQTREREVADYGREDQGLSLIHI